MLTLQRQQPEISLSNFDEIIAHYDKLIRSMVRKAKTANLEDDDLYQEALCGVVKAINGWNADQYTMFPPFLKTCLQNHLGTYVRDYLPHFYRKDQEASEAQGKSIFIRESVYIDSLDERNERYTRDWDE